VQVEALVQADAPAKPGAGFPVSGRAAESTCTPSVSQGGGVDTVGDIAKFLRGNADLLARCQIRSGLRGARCLARQLQRDLQGD
jgi:hypothetical protein